MNLKEANEENIGGEKRMLAAVDGYPLTATVYRPGGPAKAKLLVAGATAVPQGFYRAFAQHAAQRNYEVMTFDYRGIGLSRKGPLKGFRATFLDWARLDLAAAVNDMATEGLPLFMVGHSFAGHAFGLLPNHDRVAGLYTFATGAGWHGWMPPLERVRVLTYWRVLGPLVAGWKGYLAWNWLGLGEDLPLGVYRDWKRWCSKPRYFFDDPDMAAEVTKLFDRVQTPMVAANAVDDLWAPPSSRDAFMAGYRHALLQRVDIEPESRGLKEIGHMGYFRRNARPLWDDVLAFFEQTAAAIQC